MTKEDIIRMAREADREWDCDRDMVEWLEWFAALIASRVAAASASVEREACAQLLDEMAARDKLSNYYAVAAKAIRARGQE